MSPEYKETFTTEARCLGRERRHGLAQRGI